MRIMFCTRCSSVNHMAFDCSRPNQNLTAPVAEPAAVAGARPKPTIPAQPASTRSSQPLPAAGPVFEARTRFAGCPLVCLATNLPGFDTEAEAERWRGRWGHGSLRRQWRCECGKWHFISDSGRSHLPARFKPFLRAETKRRLDAEADAAARRAMPQGTIVNKTLATAAAVAVTSSQASGLL